MEHRYIPIEKMETREDGDELHISGYFAVFNSVYELWPGATESIAPGAFDDALNGDIRALWNHNPDIVMGRTTAGTATAQADNHGLWCDILINRMDTDSMNGYARTKRGDVTGASFGFDIADQEADYREDGTVHWTIKKVFPLYEFSPCTFPAYQETAISARKHDFEELKRKRTEAWKHRALERLRGNGD